MKNKIIAVLLSTILIFSNTINVFADTYSFDDVYMSLDFNTDLYDGIIKSGEPIDKNTVSIFGLSAEELAAYLNSNGIKFDAVCFNPYYIETTVVIRQDENSKIAFNLNDFTNEELRENMFPSMEEAMENTITLTDINIKSVNDVKFIKFDFYLNNQDPTMYGRSYATVYNGYNININFYAYSEADIANFGNEIDSVVESIDFSQKLENPNASASSFVSGLTESAVSGALSGFITCAIILIIVFVVKNRPKQ